MNEGRIDLIAGCIAVRHAGPDQHDDGPDFQNFCTTHRWASLPLTKVLPEFSCPHCRVQIEEARGRDRYAALEQAMLAQQISFVNDTNRSRRPVMIDSTHTIALEPVPSKALAAIGYDVDAHQLAVQFLNGHIRHYANVPLSVWQAFQEAPSKGAFYAAEIKRFFTAERVTGVCGKCGDVGLLEQTCTDCGTATYQK